MKLLIIAFFAVSAFASPNNREGWVDIDWSNVVPMTEMPGFWDGRDIKPSAFDSRGPSRNGRIVGGVAAGPNSIPFQAALMVLVGTTNGLCGGSLVSTTWVLTAAHCVTTTSTSITVILGAHDITSTTETTQQRSTVLPANYRNHPLYNPNNFNNDISLILLPAAVALNANVAVVALPALTVTDNYAGVIGRISGWGRTSDTSQIHSPTLRWAQNQIITNAACTVTYGPNVIVDSTICQATTLTPCASGDCGGICGGDTGGPLVLWNVAGGHLQIGVASFGAAAGCTAGHPAGFTRITSVRQWIQTTAGI